VGRLRVPVSRNRLHVPLACLRDRRPFADVGVRPTAYQTCNLVNAISIGTAGSARVPSQPVAVSRLPRNAVAMSNIDRAVRTVGPGRWRTGWPVGPAPKGALEIDAAAHRLGYLAIGQIQQELQHADRGQLSGRETRAPITRVPVEEVLVVP
jgi:hypothetical protein